MSTTSSRPTATLESYFLGFLMSILLTLVAYIVVVNKLVAGWSLVFVISLLAVLQVSVQLIFFIHLSSHRKQRWNLVIFAFMVATISLIVFASLWIMSNLGYHMSPKEVEQTIIKEEGISR